MSPRSSLALGNLRAFVILLVLSFHSVLAYLHFLPAAPSPFDSPPYVWRAFPIIDSQRWFGFDLYCAWQDVFLMSLFFFLSGLFVWPSLARKGAANFLHGRMLRLGVPFLLVVAVLMPPTLYPTYLQTAIDGSISEYWRHWLALPFWPCGPMWFLWLLLVADFIATALHRFAPAVPNLLIRLSASAEANPARYFAAFLCVSLIAYVPLAFAFSPSAWFQRGPFAFQLSRPLHYAVYFFAGLGLGAGGVERGLLAADGPLVRRWPLWVIAAALSLLAWMGLMGLALAQDSSYHLALQISADLSFVFACFASCFAVLATVLRFAARRLPLLAGLGSSAYGMYLVHYPFVVWLQFAMLGLALPAIIKGAVVFGGTLLLSWSTVAALRYLPSVAHIIGAEGARGAAAS
ncbi:MAG: acyltransferase family protein [Alphaproteobacteria bacterium]|nr:acyltransferase family protein [Alphaproteobacteria bacterium]